MVKQVLISISGTHDHESEPIGLLTPGTYSDESGFPTLAYEESELSGMLGTTTKIIFNGTEISLERTGTFKSFTVFSKRQWTQSAAVLGGIPITFSVFPNLLEYELTPNEGWLELACDMLLGSINSKSHISVEYHSTEDYKSAEISIPTGSPAEIAKE